MSKKQRSRYRHDSSIAEKSLPLSVILPLADRIDKLELFLESLLKIRKPFNKEYEIILFARESSDIETLITDKFGSNSLLDQGVFKILHAGETTSENLSTGVQASRKENILIIDHEYLERNFNFDDLFNIAPGLLAKEKLVFPLFREQGDPIEQKKSHPVLLLKKNLATYLFNELPVSPVYHEVEMMYRLSKLGIRGMTQSISQVNPFGEKQVSSAVWKHLKMKSNLFLDWFIRIPLSEISSSPHKKYSFLKVPSYFRALFVSTALILAILMPIMSLDAGLSGDDEKHYQHAKKVYNYFESGGEDVSALSDPTLKLNYYGQSFDLITYIVNKVFKIESEYESRHFQIAIIGFLTILFAGLLAVLLSGYRAGLITMVLMFFAPRFLGHSFNNPMDIPFAFGYIFTIYHTFRFLLKLPAFSKRSAIWIGLGIAFTISIRIGGLMLIPYIFMFAGLYVWFNKWEFKRFSKSWLSMVWKGLIYLLIISISAYFISLIPWPYGFQKPLKNPFEALSLMSNISVSIRVLFDGAIHWSNMLPWYYISMNILYSVPIILIVGFVLNAFLFPLYRNRIQPVFMFLLYFVVIFPVAYVVYKESNVYGGWRHLLFIFPSMAVIAGISFDTLIRKFKPLFLKIAVTLIIVAGIVHPGIHIIKNHPFEYIYFNEILGINKAYGRFETDYYLNSLKQGTEWLIENVLEEKEGSDTLRIAANANIGYYLRKNRHQASPIYTRYYDRAAYDWDYAVYFCNYIDPYQLNNDLWPPDGTIHTIQVGDAPVCAIVKRETKKDFEAIQHYQRRDLQKAIPMLEEVNSEYPRIEYVKLRLAEAYIQVNQMDRAHSLVNECLEIYPEYDKALNIRGIAYLQANELGNAINTFMSVTRINYRFAPAYHNLGLAYIRQNEVEKALSYFEKSIEVNFRYKPSYLAIADILQSVGRNEEAQQYINAANSF
jgi:tetratricopeptide (TPR) repeat protein